MSRCVNGRRARARLRTVGGWCLAVVVVLASLGCRPSAKPEGTWVMAASSSRYLPAQMKDVTPRLVVKSDGSFSASNLPGAFHYSTDIVSNTGRGRWNRRTEEGRDLVQLIFDGSYGTQLEFSDSWGGPTLTYFLGDPDQGHRIELKKQ